MVKNERSVGKSLNRKDLDYLKSFKNISIVYSANLHAKYYGNEKNGMLTSINLYDYSFNNNIEFGVFTEYKSSFLGKDNDMHDIDAWNECMKIANESDVVFIKRPVCQIRKRLLGKEDKIYGEPDILVDNTDKFYGYKSRNSYPNSEKKLSFYPKEISVGASNIERPKREDENTKTKNRL